MVRKRDVDLRLAPEKTVVPDCPTRLAGCDLVRFPKRSISGQFDL